LGCTVRADLHTSLTILARCGEDNLALFLLLKLNRAHYPWHACQ